MARSAGARLEVTAARSGPRRRGRSGSSCWPAASSASAQGTTRCVRGSSAPGSIILVLGLVFERLRPHLTDIGSRVDRRAVSVALFVGFIVGYAQTAPLVQLPIYFQIALGYGPILAVVATIPFMAALVVAGPVAGILIGRFQPRTIVVGGVAAVGAGNILAALVLGPRTPYIGFGVAMLLIGAGFVVATTVRTAIIFASVPRGLPATAAALNEVSVSMGARAALVLVTTFVAGAATSAYGGSLVGPSACRGRRRPRPVPRLPARDRDARVPGTHHRDELRRTWRHTARPIPTRSGPRCCRVGWAPWWDRSSPGSHSVRGTRCTPSGSTRTSGPRPPPRLRLLRHLREQVPPPPEAVDDPVEVALALPVAFVVGQARVAAVLMPDERATHRG